MPDVRAAITAAVRSALTELGVAEIDPALETSAKPDFGDWSTPAALRAARLLHRPPLEIATELRGKLMTHNLAAVAEWTVSAPGYVNARLDDSVWAPSVMDDATSLNPDIPVPMPAGTPAPAGRTLIEHTNINTNKAAHVGHLRNACLGDSIARILRRTGQSVEVNNYIDDTGAQVADVVVGIRELGIEQNPDEPFDQFCSRVYVEVCRRYEAQPELQERRRATLHAIEAGGNEIATFVKQLSRRIVSAHLRTMGRFGIEYELLTWESDILRLGFWQHAFDELKRAGSIVLAETGRNAGCWVLPADASGDTDSVEAKVLVKSDGVATYTAKDIAYQLWKFGLLGLDFGYTPWDSSPHSPWTTTSEQDTDHSAQSETVVRFGHASRVINVIDARQAYLQAIVRRALHQLGHEAESQQSIHLAYEVVALSAAAAQQLGIELHAGRQRYALSGRKGIEVRADDLLDRAIEAVTPGTDDDAVAVQVATGAIRYYLEKFSVTQVIAFDFTEALRVDGDTGVYLQYAHARATGILRKVEDDGQPLVVPELEPVERALLHRIDQYPYALAEAAAQLAPNVLCAYTLSLATALHDFYERTPPMIREEDATRRRFRRRLVASTRSVLADALGTLGIAAPEHI